MASDFDRELTRWGPDRIGPIPNLSDSRAYCRRLALSHYENFSVASLFVPRRLLRHFHSVYAYCRWSDDLADETADDQRSADLLNWWRGELLQCYGGEPRHPITVALGETIDRFRIPAEPFLNLLSAFAQDQSVKRYASFDQLLAYCRNSANPVGRIVLHLGECHNDERGKLSDHICTALQLANFWQDVVRDFEIGRIYLPTEDCERFGVSENDIAQRRISPAFRDLMRFEVNRTREMFNAGLPLISLMPGDLRVQIELFARGGLAILRKIERQNFDVLSSRPRLAKWEKAALMVRVIAGRCVA